MTPEERNRQIEVLMTRAKNVERMRQELDTLHRVFPLPDKFIATFRPLNSTDPYMSDELLRLVLRKGIGLLIEQLEVAIEVTLEGSEVIAESLHDEDEKAVA